MAFETDIAIIGAGPCGLFTVFEAGLLKLRCHIIDALPAPGGQLAEIYPKKPIYDIPGHPEILAGELVDKLLEQIDPFHPGFTLGERAENYEKLSDGRYKISTNRGTEIIAPVICIAGGLGSFEPRKPPIDNIQNFEDRGVSYIIREPSDFHQKNIVIAGGGDSALDWAIYFAEKARSVTLVHRRKSFRGAPDSVEKVQNLLKDGKINLYTETEVVELYGKNKLEAVGLKPPGQEDIRRIDTDYFLPLFGLIPKLGPIGSWGLEMEKNALVVNTFDYSTNVEGIYAVGDVNTYPGKLKLILCGFHEATLMVQSAYRFINDGKNPSFKYTTVTGIKEMGS